MARGVEGIRLMNFQDLHSDERDASPVDIIEVIAALNDWSFERSGADEISICVAGRWSDYDVSFSWMDGVESIHLACGFSLRSPDHRLSEVRRLVSMINEQMLSGHFDFWPDSNMVIYRQSLSLAGGVQPTNRQVQSMLATAVDGCERYFQAFQFALWAGRSAEDALACSLFETIGEA